MATVVTTLNYLTSTRAGNTLRDNGGFSGISYIPSAAVSEAFTTFTADGTFSPQGGSADLTVVTVAGGGGAGSQGYGSGGGAGGVRSATNISNPGSSVGVTVGGGGAGGNGTPGSDGGNTFIGPSPSPVFICSGGGGGPPGNNETGRPGGSGSGGNQSTGGAGNAGGYSPS